MDKTPPPVLPWQTKLMQHLLPVLALFVLLRGGLWLAGYTVRIALLPRLGPAERTIVRSPDNVPLDIWDRYDSFFYIEIATRGYSDQPNPDGYPNTAFFPLYPLLIAGVLPLVGNPVVAGLVVGNLALLAGVLALYQLALIVRPSDRAFALRAVLYLLIFPSSFFLSAIYTEGLFFALTVGSFLAGMQRRWLLGGILGLLAAATRAQGIVLYGVLLLQWLAARDDARLRPLWGGTVVTAPAGRRETARALIGVHLVPLGLLAFLAYLTWRFGDSDLFFRSQAAWQRGGFNNPLWVLWGDVPGLLRQPFLSGDFSRWRHLLEVATGTAALALCVPIWRRFGLPAAALVAASLLLVLFSGKPGSMLRYLATLFPLFLLLAEVGGRRPLLNQVLVALSAMLLAALFAVYANVQFVG